MAKTISKKISVKASADITLGNPQPGIKPLGLSQISSSMKYKTVIILLKNNKQKSLSFTNQS